MVQAKHLSKAFKDPKRGLVKAVDDLSFGVARGEILGLLGPNGAGKTTTLRLLATIMRPTSGTAVLNGCDVVEQPGGVRRQIGFLSGDMGLYHRLTPREILRFFAGLNGYKGQRLTDRVTEVLAILEMNEFADVKTDKLSTGMRQRAAIARALVHDPPILILDEPTAGLDVPSAQIIEEFILNARRAGKCIILSTHVMEEAEYLCDRIAVIHEGGLRASGTMESLRELTGKQRLREVFLALLGKERPARNEVHHV